MQLPLHADLVYDRETGEWTVEGGVLEPLLGESSGAENALELMNEAGRNQEKGNRFTALKLYNKVHKDYPNSIFAPEALYQASLLYQKRHQFDKAFEYLEQIVREYPGYDKYNQVIGAQYRIADDLADGERPYYWGIIPGFRDYEAAMDYYNKIVENGPYTEYAPLALMRLAGLARERDKPEEAIDALDRLVNYYPDSFLASDAYLELAQTFSGLVEGSWYDQGATREAISYYQDYLVLYPDSPMVGEAEDGLTEMRNTLANSKFLLGDFFYRYRNNGRAARVFFNEAITIDPESEAAAKAREKLEKIESGIEAPKTPVDMIFGRYKDPSRREIAEETEVEAHDEGEFAEETDEDEITTPGTVTEETIYPDGSTQSEESFAPIEQVDDPLEETQAPRPPIIPIKKESTPPTRDMRGGARRVQ